MYRQCVGCGMTFEREPGYFLGSIYVNYGLTAVIVTVVYLGGTLATDAGDPTTLLVIAAAISVLFPIAFFRWARSFWLGMDQYIDPR